MPETAERTPGEILKPPALSVGVLGWIRANLFNGWLNSLLTIIALIFLWKTVPSLLRWLIIDAAWFTSGAQCREVDGACWSVITRNFRFIIFGFYPFDQHWRPTVAMLLLFGLLFLSQNRRYWNKYFGWTWILGLAAMGLLMRGGIFGLTAVETGKWGGLPLTLLLSVFGLTAAYPLGVLLALGRQSRMPMIRWLCVVYIELIRGVPLISLLFMGSIIFPLFNLMAAADCSTMERISPSPASSKRAAERS